MKGVYACYIYIFFEGGGLGGGDGGSEQVEAGTKSM